MPTAEDPGLSSLQRVVVLRAMVDLIAEHGFTEISAGMLGERSGVTRAAIVEQFGDLRDCFAEIITLGADHVAGLISEAFAIEAEWRGRLRLALAAALGFLDDDPSLARVLLVEVFGAGTWALQQRIAHIHRLQGVIAQAWPEELTGQPPLAPDGVMAALLGVVHEHLLSRSGVPAISLLGPLMGIVMAPYLGLAATNSEIRAGEVLAGEILEHGMPYPSLRREALPRVTVPALLLDPRSRRARACLLYLARNPGASNHQVAAGVGIARHAQSSALLARLLRLRLLVKTPAKPGGANGWCLSSHGAILAAVVDQRRAIELHGPLRLTSVR